MRGSCNFFWNCCSEKSAAESHAMIAGGSAGISSEFMEIGKRNDGRTREAFETEKEAEGLSMKEILFVLRKHLALLIIMSLAFALIGYAFTKYRIQPEYEADTTVLVSVAPTRNAATITSDQIAAAQQLVGTYAVILKSDMVMGKVVQNLKLKESPGDLTGRVTVTAVNASEVMDVSVRDTDPQRAANIANEITAVAPGVITATVNAGFIEVLSPAVANRSPVSPNRALNTEIAFLIGLALSVIISFMLELLNETVVSDEDVRRYFGLTVLSIIPDIKKKSNLRYDR